MVGLKPISVGATTVRTVLPGVTTPSVAEIVAVPAETDPATPFDPAALLIVATPGASELQVTEFVRSLVEASL